MIEHNYSEPVVKSFHELNPDPEFNQVSDQEIKNVLSEYKGIGYLIHLKKEYEAKIQDNTRIRDSCPYPEIRETLGSKIIELQNLFNVLDDKITGYNNTLIELQKIESLIKRNECDVLYREMLCNHWIQEIESYNLTVLNASRMGLSFDTVLQLIGK